MVLGKLTRIIAGLIYYAEETRLRIAKMVDIIPSRAINYTESSTWELVC